MKLYLPLVMLFFTSLGFSQERCPESDQETHDISLFESWLEKTIAKNKIQARQNNDVVYTIPVVVHIIHQGEPIGMGDNLAFEKVLEQIDIINQDFNLQNPRIGNIPEVFVDVAAESKIQFILARQDPNGLPTDGVVRLKGSQSSYTFAEDYILKAESYWDSNNYLNIWVAQVDFLGWASMPTQSGLSGIIQPETDPSRDGIVVDTDWFGINFGNESFNSFGQTVSHEIGHFLGLRHIWGDGACNSSDYCEDTPSAIKANSGIGNPCTFPIPDVVETAYDDGNSCTDENPDLPDMFMNFMDYSNDECMNMFTLDQKERMRTVLENSPRRESLRFSPALNYPIGVLENDLAFFKINETPKIINCETYEIGLSIVNHGSEEIESFSATYSLNNTIVNFERTGLLIPSGSTYEFDVEMSGFTNGENFISWTFDLVNGRNDDNDLNNYGETSVLVDLSEMDSPFREQFDSENWISIESIGLSNWAPISIFGNRMLSVQSYDEQALDRKWVVTPTFSLSDLKSAGLFFDISYGRRFRSNGEFLEIIALNNCTGLMESLKIIDLRSNRFPESFDAYFPDNEWVTEFINLDHLTNEEEIRLAFIFNSYGGNNLYLDNIELTNNSDPNQPRPDENQIIIYPNPASKEFQVTLSFEEKRNIIVQLLDVTGKIILEEFHPTVLNETLQFQVDDQEGLHFLNIISENFNRTESILIRQ